jgi:hypothetical protein
MINQNIVKYQGLYYLGIQGTADPDDNPIGGQK